jgi:signal transduction histidine kinase
MFEEELQNNKMQILGKLAATLVHEIRNPLSAIKLNLDFIKLSSGELPAEVNQSVNSCLEAANRMQALVESLLGFSRKSNSNEKNSINDITDIAVSIMQNNAKILKIKIEKQLDYSLDDLVFDKNKILQVILNLITNAIEASSSNGIIKVKTYGETISKECIYTLEVEDNGIGIKDEDKNKIFGDFYTGKKNGTGLGLSVCKSILEEYNAKLDFESDYGTGSRFFIRFVAPNAEKE